MNHRVTLPHIGTVAAWRDAARPLAAAAVPGHLIRWHREGAAQADDLFAAEPPTADPPQASRRITVPKRFPTLMAQVGIHADPERFALLYDLLTRLQDTPRLLDDPADPAVRRATRMAAAVRRDMHKMKAFVRFQEIETEGTRRRFAAWFEPDNPIVEATAPFFARRFADMDWMIATPDMVARFEHGALSFHPGAAQPDLPRDATSALWDVYFRNIFNPARVKTSAMRSEMPLKYWKNMPETRLIPDMLAEAETRVQKMRDALPEPAPDHADRIAARYRDTLAEPPPATDLQALARQARGCTRCDLCHIATQTVTGEGPEDAALMVVGEQPGDTEDLAGRPFVGPAGQLLDTLLAEAELPRDRLWMTNAVKHFKHVPRGKKRIHARPNMSEITQCRWWLDQERTLLKPRLTLALGATATTALTGRSAALGPRRGKVEDTANGPVLITIHPSYLLRLPDAGRAAEERARLTEDLRQAKRLAAL